MNKSAPDSAPPEVPYTFVLLRSRPHDGESPTVSPECHRVDAPRGAHIARRAAISPRARGDAITRERQRTLPCPIPASPSRRRRNTRTTIPNSQERSRIQTVYPTLRASSTTDPTPRTADRDRSRHACRRCARARSPSLARRRFTRSLEFPRKRLQSRPAERGGLGFETSPSREERTAQWDARRARGGDRARKGDDKFILTPCSLVRVDPRFARRRISNRASPQGVFRSSAFKPFGERGENEATTRATDESVVTTQIF